MYFIITSVIVEVVIVVVLDLFKIMLSVHEL